MVVDDRCVGIVTYYARTKDAFTGDSIRLGLDLASQAAIALERTRLHVALRERDGEPFRTDNGSFVVDCRFGGIDKPAQLEQAIKALPAVVESGLFVGLTGALVVGGPGGGQVKWLH